MIAAILFSFATGGAALFLYLYYYRKGQFEELEETKYQMFYEETDKNENDD